MSNNFVFNKNNYKLMFIGIAAVLLGFILMVGGASDDPNVFDEGALFSHVRITLAPILIVGGYVVVIFSIMKKRPEDQTDVPSDSDAA